MEQVIKEQLNLDIIEHIQLILYSHFLYGDKNFSHYMEELHNLTSSEDEYIRAVQLLSSKLES